MATPTFHLPAYAGTYPSFGAVVADASCPVPVHVRAIPGTDLLDGALPWPYVLLDGAGADALVAAHPDLVTITGVLAPDAHPPLPEGSRLRRFKDHFVLSTGGEMPALSHKSRANLRRGARRWASAMAGSTDDWDVAIALYRLLVQRRGLQGSPFDLFAAHFHALRAVAGIGLVGVRDEHGWGSMAITATADDGTHLLHIVNSDEGLRSHASYVLMHHLTEDHFATGRTLALGGVPQGDTGGVATFKARWSNTIVPTWLLTLVLRPDEYAQLTGTTDTAGFFPAYRSGWT